MSNRNTMPTTFALLALILAVAVGVITNAVSYQSLFAQIADHSQNVVDFVKSQSMAYDSFNSASATKSLMRSIENAGQLARDVQQDGGAVDQASLGNYASELSLTGAFVLTPEGEPIGAYSSDDVTFEDIRAAVTDTSALMVVQHPVETYTARVSLDDGSYIDVACAGRLDQPGLVVAIYHTKLAFANRYTLTLQSLLAGYNPTVNGSIVIENDGEILAANMVDAHANVNESISQNDRNVVNAIKEQCELGQTQLVKVGTESYVASFYKARDNYVFTYSSASGNMGTVAGNVALALALYAVVVAAFVLIRRHSQHKHLHELVQQEHEYGEKLAESARAAESANRAKTEFLQRMSHDIRTPINGIRGMVEVGNAFDSDVAKQRECRKKIWNASGILLELVDEVLDMSKLESGEVELDVRPCNLAALIDDVYEVLERLAEQKHVTIVCDHSDVAHPVVMASQLHLKRSIMNIAGNAVKYNKEGGTVRLTCEEVLFENGVGTYRITVADTGIGMSKEFQEHLFEPFSRETQRIEDQSSGTGLGTVIAKQLIELMGGTITFTSALGVGTTYVIELPFTVDEHAEAPVPAETASEAVSLDGMNILLAEDNELNQEIAVFILTDAGANVTAVRDGKEAVDAFAQAAPGTFDLMILDIMMPHVDGYQAASTIRAMQRDDAATIPIVAMSANAFADDRRRSREAGMNDHLAKPIDSNKLIQAISKIVRE